MATLIYSASMSLDGFIAGPAGDMSWLNRHPGPPAPAVDALVPRIGCLLIGGRSFRGEDPNAGTEAEGAFEGQYQGGGVVLTSRPPAEPRPGLEFESDLTRAVDRARELAGDRHVNIIGAATAGSCLHAGLLDEILLHVVPVLLGDGTRAFGRTDLGEIALEQVSDGHELWYRVVR